MAQDVGALKKLKAGIRVSVADASGEEEPFPPPSPSSSKPSSRDELPRMAWLQTLRGGRSRVFLVSRGGVSVWARGLGRSVGRHPRRCGREIGAAADKEEEERGGGAGEEGGSDGGEGVRAVSVLRLCKVPTPLTGFHSSIDRLVLCGNAPEMVDIGNRHLVA